MNLTEQDKEDITDMIIESRDVGEELNVVAKDSNIEIIEDFINEIKDFELNKDVVEIVNALEDILEEREADKKRIKELEEENKLLLNSKVGIDLSYDDYIPVQKVKDKIEELKKEYEDSKDENGESKYYYPDYTIRKLEELLNDK